MEKRVNLSVVILSYNTKELLKNCLDSLSKVNKEADFEIIVVDNASSDGSQEMVKKDFPDVKMVRNSSNLGFAAGNNAARKYCQGKYVLFLNSDTSVRKNTIKKSLDYLLVNGKVGALSCKLVLPSGEMERDSRRAFITPWTGLVHIFLKLDRVFPKSKLFAKYWYGYIPENTTHEVDVIQGAFFLVRKKILDGIGWFDEDYFLDGEDIDICWRIKEKGWKIVYFPKVSIIHFKGASKGKDKSKKNVPLSEKLKFRMTGVTSMEIFYKKRLWKKYPLALNLFVLTGIKLMKLIRLVKIVLLGL